MFKHTGLGLFRKNKPVEVLGICFVCQSPIEDVLCRKLILKDSHGEEFSLKYHYFPPCFVRGDVPIPDGCEYFREGYGGVTEFLVKHPTIDVELARIDDMIDLARGKSNIEDYK